MKELIEWIIYDLPSDGKWWGDGHLVFIDSAMKMLEAGMSIVTVKKILEDCYFAVANEYGE